MNRTGKLFRGFTRMARWPFEGLGIVFALVLAVIATIVVLIAPEHHWGPQMWPFYLGAAVILLWVAIDLWSKLSPSQKRRLIKATRKHGPAVARAAAKRAASRRPRKGPL